MMASCTVAGPEQCKLVCELSRVERWAAAAAVREWRVCACVDDQHSGAAACYIAAVHPLRKPLNQEQGPPAAPPLQVSCARCHTTIPQVRGEGNATPPPNPPAPLPRQPSQQVLQPNHMHTSTLEEQCQSQFPTNNNNNNKASGTGLSENRHGPSHRQSRRELCHQEPAPDGADSWLTTRSPSNDEPEHPVTTTASLHAARFPAGCLPCPRYPNGHRTSRRAGDRRRPYTFPAAAL